jgi:hypothetical protein
MSDDAQYLAIACCSGGFKGIFVHGVLSALEAAGISAGAYAASSSSVFPAICAAIGQANTVGLHYWRGAIHVLHQPGNGMSEVVLQSITAARHLACDILFQPGRPRFLIATSAVKTPEAAELTQGEGARRLGRRLLLQAARADRNWRDQHLEAYIFDTAAPDVEYRLTPDIIEAVTYASTRMLHAWSIPAWIRERPYIDASYTCACPALELAQRGYREIIAIATEPGPLYRDIFQSEPIPEHWGHASLHIVRPEKDIATLGADFTSVSEDGMEAAYEYGQQVGAAFAASWRQKES